MEFAHPVDRPLPLRWCYIALGSVALAFGLVGVFAPFVPTTPFLLVSAWAYARGSRRLHRWLLGHPRLGPFLHRWWTDRSVPRRAKYGGIALVWIGIGASMLFATDSLAVRTVMLVVALTVSAFLLTLRTWSPDGPA